MQMGLNELKPGREAVVIQTDVEESLSRRLEDFGFVPGTRICCCYRNPGGQVTAIECRGSVIALRTCDLKKIQVRSL